MTPLVVGLSLIALMLLVRVWTQWKELEPARPLDVDDGLPFPELAQASSVISLTALYTAYLTMAFILGLPALCGVAVGGVLSLIGIRRAIRTANCDTYETLLMTRCFAGPNGVPILYVAIAAQIGFGVSELLILREVAMAGFHMAPRHATVLMLSMALIPYYYCLVGGYRALFRTDVVQFVAIAIMCAWIAFYGIRQLAAQGAPQFTFAPNTSWWTLPFAFSARWQAWASGGSHFALGAVMGAAFIAASPDTWKRVFVAVKRRPTPHAFWRLVGAGAIPFIAIAPLLIVAPRPKVDEYVPVLFFFRLSPLLRLDAAVVFGVLATFLSSFAGALLSAAHLLLLDRRRRDPVPLELGRFQTILGGATLAVVFATLAFVARGNPYFFGYLLLGPYAIVGGAMVGARGRMSSVAPWVGRLIVVLLVGWFLFVAQHPDIVDIPRMEELNGVPVGVGFFAVTYIVVALTAKFRRSTEGA